MHNHLKIAISHYSGFLSRQEIEYLNTVHDANGRAPTLSEVWSLMDEAWIACDLDETIDDAKLSDFYKHPVWLLNGLFIDQDSDSIANRDRICTALARFSPTRIADYGGGFGALATRLAQVLPNSKIDILEPYPHPLAKHWASAYPNIEYVEALEGEYNALVATDVFEHLSDPVQAVFDCSQSLSYGGLLLTANCFAPVIKCHLPQHFHLEFSWSKVMSAMGLNCLSDGPDFAIYQKTAEINLELARLEEYKSTRLYKYIVPIVRFLPRGKKRTGRTIYSVIS